MRMECVLVVADGKPNCALVMSYLVANKRRREMNRFFEKRFNILLMQEARERCSFFSI